MNEQLGSGLNAYEAKQKEGEAETDIRFKVGLGISEEYPRLLHRPHMKSIPAREQVERVYKTVSTVSKNT